MILELALAVTAGGAALGLLNAIRARRARSPESTPLGQALAAARTTERGLVSGDVLMIPGEELALGGSVTLDEGGVVLVLFALVGARRDRWLVQLDRTARDLALTEESSSIVGEVPATLPLLGRTLTLERRGVARALARGEGVPMVEGARAPFVVLSERGGRVAIVIDLPGQRLALVGERLDPRVVDRLGGGATR